MVRSPGTPLYMRQHMDCSDVSLLGTNTYYSPALYSHCVLVRDPEITIMGMKGSWRELMPKSGSSSCLLHRNSVGWRSSTRSSLQTDSTTPWKEITRCSKALIDPETQRSTAQEGKGEVSQTNTSRNARGVRNRCQRDVSLFFFLSCRSSSLPTNPRGGAQPPSRPNPSSCLFPVPLPSLTISTSMPPSLRLAAIHFGMAGMPQLCQEAPIPLAVFLAVYPPAPRSRS